jgi:hypothetical protein
MEQIIFDVKTGYHNKISCHLPENVPLYSNSIRPDFDEIYGFDVIGRYDSNLFCQQIKSGVRTIAFLDNMIKAKYDHFLYENLENGCFSLCFYSARNQKAVNEYMTETEHEQHTEKAELDYIRIFI